MQHLCEVTWGVVGFSFYFIYCNNFRWTTLLNAWAFSKYTALEIVVCVSVIAFLRGEALSLHLWIQNSLKNSNSLSFLLLHAFKNAGSARYVLELNFYLTQLPYIVA